MWSVKFARLCYLAFLDCEDQIKNILIFMFGAFAILAIMLFIPIIGDLSLISTLVILNLTESLFVFTIFAFQIVISAVYCASFLKIAYEYDNRMWGPLTTLKTIEENLAKQYDTDKREAQIKQDAKDAALRKEIECLKKKK